MVSHPSGFRLTSGTGIFFRPPRYSPVTEAGQAIPVRHGQERGEYLHAMYLNNFPATAGGRELSAFPKVMGDPALYADHAALLGTLDYGSERPAYSDTVAAHYYRLFLLVLV